MFIDNYSSRVTPARIAQPSEMGSSLLYLASDGLNYVTGRNIIVDGGLTTR